MRTARLGDIATVIRGVSFEGGDASAVELPGLLPILRAGNITDSLVIDHDLIWVPAARVSPEQQMKLGDIAICLSSGSASVVGKTALLDQRFDGSIGAFCGIIRPGPRVMPEFLAAWLRSPAYRSWRDVQARGASIKNLRVSTLTEIRLPLPTLDEQRRLTNDLTSQLREVARARTATIDQMRVLSSLRESVLRESLAGTTSVTTLGDALAETKQGIGSNWNSYRVIGATRAGLAPAKEAVGKSPQRYKLADRGTIFYNPMRILLGSIAHVDLDQDIGITSPDYVVFKADSRYLDDRWLYEWLRSWRGKDLIRSLARGAVRERLLFGRLAAATMVVPPVEVQRGAADTFRIASALGRGLDAQLSEVEALAISFIGRAFRAFDSNDQEGPALIKAQ
jgi:type I restriction enzyme S subunit